MVLRLARTQAPQDDSSLAMTCLNTPSLGVGWVLPNIAFHCDRATLNSNTMFHNHWDVPPSRAQILCTTWPPSGMREVWHRQFKAFFFTLFNASFSDRKLKLDTVIIHLIFYSYEGAFLCGWLFNLVLLLGGQSEEASIHPSCSTSPLCVLGNITNSG